MKTSTKVLLVGIVCLLIGFTLTYFRINYPFDYNIEKVECYDRDNHKILDIECEKKTYNKPFLHGFLQVGITLIILGIGMIIISAMTKVSKFEEEDITEGMSDEKRLKKRGYY